MASNIDKFKVSQGDIIAAYKRIIGVAKNPCLVLFVMPGCESCRYLEDDLGSIAEIREFDTILVIEVRPDDIESCKLAGSFEVKEFPVAYVLVEGRIVSGWAGYDWTIPTDTRRTGLSEIIDRALKLVNYCNGDK